MEIPRLMRADLVRHMEQDEITLLIGPRQVGKTTLLRAIADDLTRNGAICLFFNLDIDADAQYFSSQQKFVDRVEALSGGKRAYVFIDEVQRIENAGLFLKGVYDRKLPHKWVATGSGSLELKEKIAESLAGRKRNFFLHPVTMEEFLSYRLSADTSRLPALLQTSPLDEERFLLEYLQFGGYPRVITSTGNDEKRHTLAEIFQSYVERDLQVLLRVEKTRDLITLIQLISNRIGRLVNYQDLANMANLSIPTVKNYLWYCQKTFIIEELLPHFSNKEKELTKTPQYYFIDTGLRNFLLDNFHLGTLSQDFGFLFQQLVLQLLKNRFSGHLSSFRYWRTQNQAEVDFVVQTGLNLLPVEVKSEKMKKVQVEASLRSFINTYAPAEAWVVNRNLSEKMQIENTTVRFMPWWELL